MRNHIFIDYFFLCTLLFFSCQSNNSKPIEAIKQKETVTVPSTRTEPESPMARFENEILRFDTLDQQDGLVKNGILFTGSSSIRMWSTLKKDMGDLPVLNRGFGGSTIPDVLHFMGRYLFQHEPQVIVFYCGENDIASGATPETVFASFQTFVKIIETKLPETKILYISMKPSIARWNIWDKYQAGEKLIKKYIEGKPKIEYMDSSFSMLEKNGEVKKDIFIEDGLHMNAKGYEGWTAQILPILRKMYEPRTLR